MSTRLRLRDCDGGIFLDRWGFECEWAGVYVHRFEAPDPGVDLHATAAAVVLLAALAIVRWS